MAEKINVDVLTLDRVQYTKTPLMLLHYLMKPPV